MNPRNMLAAVVVTCFVSVILFQSVFMMISPQRWVRSKYALKSGEITEDNIAGRWGGIWFRVIGFLMTMTGILVLYEFWFVMM